MIVINKIVSSYFLVKAKTALSNRDNLLALELVKKAEQYDESYDVYIYKGLSEFLLKEFDNSVVSLQYGIQLIKSNQKLTFDEKKYLEYYTLDILLENLNIIKKYENIEKYESYFRNLKFDKKKVRKRILKWFPL